MGFVDVRLLIVELHFVLVGCAFVDEKCSFFVEQPFSSRKFRFLPGWSFFR